MFMLFVSSLVYLVVGSVWCVFGLFVLIGVVFLVGGSGVCVVFGMVVV